MLWVRETKIDKHQRWPKTSKHMLETLTLSMLLQIYVTLRLLEAVSPATEPLSSKQLWSAEERAENQRQLQAAAICSADCWVRLVPLCRRPSGGIYAHGSPRVSQTFLQSFPFWGWPYIQMFQAVQKPCNRIPLPQLAAPGLLETWKKFQIQGDR